MIERSRGFSLEKKYFLTVGLYEAVGVYKYFFANAVFWRLWVKITTLKRKVLHPFFLRGNFFTLQDPFRAYTLANCLIRANSSGADATAVDGAGAACGANAVCTLPAMLTPFANLAAVPPAAMAA